MVAADWLGAVAMGCESSRSIAVENTTGSKPRVQGELREMLTDLQVDVIKSTWPILALDLPTTGIKFLKEVYHAEPAVQQLFAFRDIAVADVHDNDKFKEHAEKFMSTFTLVTDHLDDQDSKELTDLLLTLGAKHATFPGFDPVYFVSFQKCMHHTWESILGEEYMEEVREAWDIVFDYIVGKLTRGYNFFVSEKDNDKSQAKPVDSTQPSLNCGV